MRFPLPETEIDLDRLLWTPNRSRIFVPAGIKPVSLFDKVFLPLPTEYEEMLRFQHLIIGNWKPYPAQEEFMNRAYDRIMECVPSRSRFFETPNMRIPLEIKPAERWGDITRSAEPNFRSTRIPRF